MQLKLKKTLTVFVLLAGTFIVPPASAALETLDIQWSGALYGNSATASGFITFDNVLLPQVGTPGFVSLPDASITDLGITITGAASGNGTFTLSDFYGVSFTTPSPLDLSTQLIGQSLSTGTTFGALVGDGSAGDLNLFGLSDTAPTGIANFTISTNQGAGDTLSITSIAASPIASVPLPTSWLLMLASLPMMLFRIGRKDLVAQL